MQNSWTGGQYSAFRVLLGAYLFVHFAYLAPWAPELFSAAGMIPKAGDSPLIGLFPNILGLVDHPALVGAMAVSAALAALSFAVGVGDKWAAAYMWLVLACFFGRNPLIANPSLPYVGWMLLAHLFVPGAPYGSWAGRGRADPDGGWRLPPGIFLAAWIVLALSYSYSGYTKLLSPSWVAGDNVAYVLENPLARDYFLRELLLALPPIYLKLLTWFILVVELLFAPIVLFARARPWAWGAMLFVQFGFAFLLSFPDLTLAMLLFHLLTFDPGWLKRRRAAAGTVLFYDGNCALCHGVVRFLLAEDRSGEIAFAALQGSHFQTTQPAAARAALPDSIVLVSGADVLIRSDAVIRLLELLGGLWRLAAIGLRAVPRPIRDRGYDAVGSIRYRVFGRKATVCPIVAPQLAERFLS